MIDYDNRIIYVDFSTLARFKACKEKARLENVNGWATRVQKTSLSFGHALHAGIAAYYDALAGGYRDTNGRWNHFSQWHNPLHEAQAAFLRDLKIMNTTIPVEIVGDERRSLERGIGLLEAYVSRYAEELYENILDANGAPLVEVGFTIPLCDFVNDGTKWTIVYCGYIDRIMRSLSTGRPTMVEFKHTTQALPRYIQQCKPNHQITGYFPYAQQLFPDLRDCEWDCVFVSSRKPDMGRAIHARFMMYGIDIDTDFQRVKTSRSKSDIDAWREDAIEDAREFARWLTSGKARWPRSAPGACFLYDGCQFRDRCSLNLDPVQERIYMDERFVIRRWEPWKQIKEAE